MKSVSTGLKAHLAGPVTTLTTCWQVIRTDGQSFAFTAHDVDLLISGVTYSSVAGFTRTAITTGSTGEVDNLDLVGFYQNDAITERDLKNGLFDYATVYVFCVNWANLAQGICRLRRGWLGECTRSPAGIFQAELRGLTQALVQEFGIDYMPLCRADLGDSKCRVPIHPASWNSDTGYTKGTTVSAATQSSDALMLAIFEAQNDGTSFDTEPVWNTTIGTTTADNDIVWLCKPQWRGIGTVVTPVDQRHFVSTALSVPALSVDPTSGLSTTASIAFRDKVATGTSIEVTDGVTTQAFNVTEDVNEATAASFAFRYFSFFNGHWGITTTLDGSGQILLMSNASGQQGNITVLNDVHRGVVVQNFMSPPFAGGAITWISGDNSGRSMEIKTYASDGTLSLWLGMYFRIQAGDRFIYYPGCDKRRDTCFYTFHNILNFRAEPDMPMFDKTLSYPDA